MTKTSLQFDKLRVVLLGSLKGGVGRSYAAVSFANALVRCGLHVVLIDMDVEAPSLPGFYDIPMWGIDGATSHGLVPWIVAGGRDPLANHLLDIPNSCGRLRLLPAGPLGSTYLSDLLDDRWRDQFERTPDRFSQDLRDAIAALEPRPDVVIIDAKAGLTPMLGTLVRHLADSVAYLFAGDRESIRVANGVRSSARDGAIVVPVLSRFPHFQDPSLVSIEQNLDGLAIPDLAFLAAAPGHEGSSNPTIPLSGGVTDSPLALDHLRLLRRLIPELSERHRSFDLSLSAVFLQAEAAMAIDYKVYRGVARGIMINLDDQSRNVAFRVATIATVLKNVVAGVPAETVGAVEQSLRRAGRVAGQAFGDALVRSFTSLELREIGPRLAAWCAFDMSTGFGGMTSTESDEVPGRFEVRIADAFLNPTDGGAPVLEGYVAGVLEMLVRPPAEAITAAVDRTEEPPTQASADDPTDASPVPGSAAWDGTTMLMSVDTRRPPIRSQRQGRLHEEH